MAPIMRAKRQRDIASAPQPSRAAAHPPSDSKNSSNDREPSNTCHEPDGTISLVAGVWMPVPRTYDPDTYDPEGQMPWTPEPEPYDPETYAAWGRKHFGDDWYEQRRIMLQERNIYAPDAVYRRRQKDLRVMEHKIEGRPFRPRDEVLDKGWQRLWARLSKDLPSVETPGTPGSFQLNDSDSNVSGYSTYPPTPEPRVLTPEPDDPWELLELNRRRFHWDEEAYQFERIFLKEGLIDEVRKQREDEEGDRRREEELEEIRKVKYLPGTLVKSGEYEDRMRKFDLRAQGWTQEQIEAADRADTAAWKWQQKNPQPRGLSLFGPPLTQEESDAYDAWLQKERAARLRIYGGPPPSESGTIGQAALDAWRRNIHARVSSQHEQEPGADATADASAPEKASRLRAPTPRATKNTSRKTRGGRITKNTAQSQSDRGTRSRRTAPTLAQASIADRRSKRARASDVVDKPDESTAQVPRKTSKRQPKVDEKRASDAVQDIDDRGLQSKPHNKGQRASRRLAHEPPQFGMFAPPVRNPSNASKPNSSGLRNRAPPKKSIAAKGAKPRGISKSGREGTNHPKRSKKRSED
ncbi:uncharacterized protein PAC_02771 [Phialocephala subalpina]|uniref:Uncharacterized protein n=1 Tax=Phialocephala subalpina TaxID=576137 RepID=A0A1L7WJE0_9HELO|nr:uncharacterized protein PAC_02771 [Phialocephala subalpina]